MNDLYQNVVGQSGAVASLRSVGQSPVHAYLFVGPRGSGKREATRAFAAQLLCPSGGCGECSTCIRVQSETHPDLVFVERVGAAISVEQAREVTRLATRQPLEEERQVIVLTDFHLVDDAAPALLKTIEEPSANTIFVIHAEQVRPELVTIVSRCVRIDFVEVDDDSLVEFLVTKEVDADRALEIAKAANGSLTRALVLATDASALERFEMWRSIPRLLNGKGDTIVALTNEVIASLDASALAIEQAQVQERDQFSERTKQFGGTATERKEFEAKQKRELRRARTDELLNGLLTLSHAYREIALATEGSDRELALANAVCVQRREEILLRNPNESLLLDALFVDLDQNRVRSLMHN